MKNVEIKGSGSDKYIVDPQGNVTHEGYFPSMSRDIADTRGGSQIVDCHFKNNLGCIGRDGRKAIEKNPTKYALGFFSTTPGYLDTLSERVNGWAGLSGTPQEIKILFEKQKQQNPARS